VEELYDAAPRNSGSTKRNRLQASQEIRDSFDSSLEAPSLDAPVHETHDMPEQNDSGSDRTLKTSKHWLNINKSKGQRKSEQGYGGQETAGPPLGITLRQSKRNQANIMIRANAPQDTANPPSVTYSNVTTRGKKRKQRAKTPIEFDEKTSEVVAKGTKQLASAPKSEIVTVIPSPSNIAGPMKKPTKIQNTKKQKIEVSKSALPVALDKSLPPQAAASASASNKDPCTSAPTQVDDEPPIPDPAPPPGSIELSRGSNDGEVVAESLPSPSVMPTLPLGNNMSMNQQLKLHITKSHKDVANAISPNQTRRDCHAEGKDAAARRRSARQIARSGKTSATAAFPLENIDTNMTDQEEPAQDLNEGVANICTRALPQMERSFVETLAQRHNADALGKESIISPPNLATDEGLLFHGVSNAVQQSTGHAMDKMLCRERPGGVSREQHKRKQWPLSRKITVSEHGSPVRLDVDSDHDPRSTAIQDPFEENSTTSFNEAPPPWRNQSMLSSRVSFLDGRADRVEGSNMPNVRQVVQRPGPLTRKRPLAELTNGMDASSHRKLASSQQRDEIRNKIEAQMYASLQENEQPGQGSSPATIGGDEAKKHGKSKTCASMYASSMFRQLHGIVDVRTLSEMPARTTLTGHR
jgi:hypothetical protein